MVSRVLIQRMEQSLHQDGLKRNGLEGFCRRHVLSRIVLFMNKSVRNYRCGSLPRQRLTRGLRSSDRNAHRVRNSHGDRVHYASNGRFSVVSLPAVASTGMATPVACRDRRRLRYSCRSCKRCCCAASASLLSEPYWAAAKLTASRSFCSCSLSCCR
jgi:hypothetical protein